MAIQQTATRALLPVAVGGAGSVGAVVGGAMAVARDVKRVKDGEMTKSQAMADVAGESLGTGLSTAAGVAVVGTLGIGGLLGFAGVIAVASGTKYLWNKAFGFKPETECAAK